MGKQKFYVVWRGLVPGVYTDWPSCETQIKNFPDAKYASFNSIEEAENAFEMPWENFYGNKDKPQQKPSAKKVFSNEIDLNSICVDAACSGNPGKMEYRGVETSTGKEIFRSKVFPLGTNNIGEFLAIVH